jgi:hypothetical protein
MLSLFVLSYDDDLVTDTLGFTRLEDSIQLIRLYRFFYR